MFKCLKMIVALISGALIIAKILSIIIPGTVFGAVGCFVGGYIWTSYCIRFYYPLETETTAPKKPSNEEDDEIDFKDL